MESICRRCAEIFIIPLSNCRNITQRSIIVAQFAKQYRGFINPQFFVKFIGKRRFKEVILDFKPERATSRDCLTVSYSYTHHEGYFDDSEYVKAEGVNMRWTNLPDEASSRERSGRELCR